MLRWVVDPILGGCAQKSLDFYGFSTSGLDTLDMSLTPRRRSWARRVPRSHIKDGTAMLTKVAQLQATLRAFVASRLATTENGASLVEYALLLALIAVVAIGALLFLGHGVNNTLQNVGQNLANP